MDKRNYIAGRRMQKARELAEAVKFCLRKGLIRPAERERMVEDREYRKEMGFRAMARRELYLWAHPEER